MESPKMYPLVGLKTYLTYAGLQMTPTQVSKYSANNGNLRNSGSTFSCGTVFAPKECLYQKEATGMESPKMYSSRWCKTLTCAGLETTPFHLSQYRGENRNLLKSGSKFCHVTEFAPKQCLYQKETTAMESPKMYSSRRCINLT